MYAIVPDNDRPCFGGVRVNGPSQIVLVFNEALDTDGSAPPAIMSTPSWTWPRHGPGAGGEHRGPRPQRLAGGGRGVHRDRDWPDGLPGNPIGGGQQRAVFGLPEAVLPGDLVMMRCSTTPGWAR